MALRLHLSHQEEDFSEYSVRINSAPCPATKCMACSHALLSHQVQGDEGLTDLLEVPLPRRPLPEDVKVAQQPGVLAV